MRLADAMSEETVPAGRMPFRPHEDERRLDFELLRDGGITKFWRPTLFESAIEALRDLGYRIIEIDGRSIASLGSLLASIARALEFPAYFGGDLDALNDCLRDVAKFDYGSDRDSSGTVIAFRGYEGIRARCGPQSEVVLDIFADRAREALLFGHRMLLLVQTDDPHISIGPLGAQHARWNAQEWFDIARHPDREARSPAEAAILEGMAGMEAGPRRTDPDVGSSRHGSPTDGGVTAGDGHD